MSYNYKVVPLGEVAGKPIFPGARRVSDEGNGYFIAQGPFVNRRGTTLAVIYKDPSGKYLVGAEKAILDTLPGEALQAAVAANPTNWHTWKCDTDKSGVVLKTNKIKADVSKNKPITVDAENIVIGCAPTATHGLGKFDPTEIEKPAVWIGDKIKTEKETITTGEETITTGGDEVTTGG